MKRKKKMKSQMPTEGRRPKKKTKQARKKEEPE